MDPKESKVKAKKAIITQIIWYKVLSFLVNFSEKILVKAKSLTKCANNKLIANMVTS
jgi:hypothetical protein